MRQSPLSLILTVTHMATIKRDSSLVVADKVLRELRRAFGNPKHVGYALVECYANCREQGYHVVVCFNDYSLDRLAVSFSESRGSDNIVVYYGRAIEFNFSGIPSEFVYRHQRTSFPYGGYKAAARMIAAWLKTSKTPKK